MGRTLAEGTDITPGYAPTAGSAFMRCRGQMPPAVAPRCVHLLAMKAQRRYLLAATAATMLGVALLGGCSSSPPMPQTTANAYLAAWARQDWAAMRQLTSDPPADFTSVNQAAFRNLTVRQASFAADPVHTNNSTASARVTERLTLAGPRGHPRRGRHAADQPGSGGDDRRRGRPGQKRRFAPRRAPRGRRPRGRGEHRDHRGRDPSDVLRAGVHRDQGAL